jgi:hypothetical protein
VVIHRRAGSVRSIIGLAFSLPPPSRTPTQLHAHDIRTPCLFRPKNIYNDDVWSDSLVGVLAEIMKPQFRGPGLSLASKGPKKVVLVDQLFRIISVVASIVLCLLHMTNSSRVDADTIPSCSEREGLISWSAFGRSGVIKLMNVSRSACASGRDDWESDRVPSFYTLMKWCCFFAGGTHRQFDARRRGRDTFGISTCLLC